MNDRLQKWLDSHMVTTTCTDCGDQSSRTVDRRCLVCADKFEKKSVIWRAKLRMAHQMRGEACPYPRAHLERNECLVGSCLIANYDAQNMSDDDLLELMESVQVIK